ncbi:MAG: hypothetical protein RQ745_00310 [Longimicrobiales bacterium]|nr:hypothetical protein [Longimicrobiales bacterium]
MHLMELRERTTSRTSILVLSLALLLAGGCATSSTGGSRAGASSDVITREEFDQFPELSAFDVVRRLHNNWLRSRSQGTSFLLDSTAIAVYISGQRDPDGVEALRSLRATQIERIEYLSGDEATMRFGPNHGGGTLLVILR